MIYFDVDMHCLHLYSSFRDGSEEVAMFQGSRPATAAPASIDRHGRSARAASAAADLGGFNEILYSTRSGGGLLACLDGLCGSGRRRPEDLLSSVAWRPVRCL